MSPRVAQASACAWSLENVARTLVSALSNRLKPVLPRLAEQGMGACATMLFVLGLTACGTHKAELPDYGVVPEFQLTAQTGQPFDSKVLKGNIWVADFMFTTCPGPCPRMTSQMHEIQQAASVKLVSFTVDPARDTPQTLAQYAQTHHASPERWSFLTGPSETLNHLGLDVFKLNKVDGSLQHSTRFVLVDRNSHIRGYYDTSQPEAIQKLVADAHLLEREPA
jgi:protein SCO1/2